MEVSMEVRGGSMEASMEVRGGSMEVSKPCRLKPAIFQNHNRAPLTNHKTLQKPA